MLLKAFFSSIPLPRQSSTYRFLQTRLNDLRFGTHQKSWAQSGEDLVIETLLDNEPGGYLDVGAGRARRFSNSYLFYRKGWSGYAVDPLASNLKEFRRLRPRDSFIQAVAGPSSSVVDFYELSPYEYSTLNKRVAVERVQSGSILLGVKQVQMLAIKDLPLSVEPASNFFFSLDAEGQELDVLRGISWQAFSPRVICIEALEIARASDALDMLQGHGYELVARIEHNLILCHREYWRSRMLNEPSAQRL